MTYKDLKLFPIIKCWLAACLLLASLLAAGQAMKKPEPIVLRAAGPAFTPREFFFDQVIDERDDRQAVAWLVPLAGQTTLQAQDLAGGGLAAIRQFVRQVVPADKSLRPVNIRLKECRVLEKPLDGNRVEGRVTVAMAFDIRRQGKTVHTLEYKGGARYQRLAGQQTMVAPTLRQSLTDALTYLNTWMNREAGRTEQLATGLKVTFRDYTTNQDPDTLFYHPGRPLRWEDFRAQPKAGPYAAAVFPSFSYEGATRVVNGIIHLDLTMKVFVVRDASWVKAGRDAYGLNHEQRHFDIVKLVAEKFKEAVRPEKLTVEDYNSLIQYQFLESWREMTARQEQYDRETRHGLDQAAQERWNQQIDRELTQVGAKK